MMWDIEIEDITDFEGDLFEALPPPVPPEVKTWTKNHVPWRYKCPPCSALEAQARAQFEHAWMYGDAYLVPRFLIDCRCWDTYWRNCMQNGRVPKYFSDLR